MIYTVNINASLDYHVDVGNYELGKTNRAAEESIVAGGKGINVSIVLENLGVESICINFYAGFSGKELLRQISAFSFKQDNVEVECGFTRINVKLHGFETTEINGMGPNIGPEHIQKLVTKLQASKAGDTIVLTGSIPKSLSSSTYADIIQELSGKDLNFVVDASGELLKKTLPHKPFLIKPNKDEIEELFYIQISDNEELDAYAKKLAQLGAQNVLVSMGDEGAILLDMDGNFYRLPAPQGKLVNAVGAGDSMLAGFIAGWNETHDSLSAFKKAICTGSASAFSESFATKNQVEELLINFNF
ncbi:MAG: 1-phosphofructokinase [Eggerthellaceae bacterium]|nr:1-phosphofructokinase [Eggerthellaceae bacterium]